MCPLGNSSSRGLSQCLTVAAITTFVRGQGRRERGRSSQYQSGGGTRWRERKKQTASPPPPPRKFLEWNTFRFDSWRQGFCSADELAPALGLPSSPCSIPLPKPPYQQATPSIYLLPANAFFINTPAKSSWSAFGRYTYICVYAIHLIVSVSGR